MIGGLYYATVFTPAMLDHPPVLMSQRGKSLNPPTHPPTYLPFTFPISSSTYPPTYLPIHIPYLLLLSPTHPPTHTGLLIFYGIPAFVFAIMLFIEKAQAEELLSLGKQQAHPPTRPPTQPPSSQHLIQTTSSSSPFLSNPPTHPPTHHPQPLAKRSASSRVVSTAPRRRWRFSLPLTKTRR